MTEPGKEPDPFLTCEEMPPLRAEPPMYVSKDAKRYLDEIALAAVKLEGVGEPSHD